MAWALKHGKMVLDMKVNTKMERKKDRASFLGMIMRAIQVHLEIIISTV
jgi:hypothetical protein